MKMNLLLFFITAVIAIAGPPQVGAEIIHLDGIANAGWYADTLTNSHLYIANPDLPGAYYYKWVYSVSTPAPLWNSRQALADDLADGVLVNGTPVGSWQVQSGGDAFNVSGHRADEIWKSLSILPGTYRLNLTTDSRAYQLNEFLWPGETNGIPVWNAYVQMYAVYNDTTTASFNFGEWVFQQGSENGVLTYYHTNVDGMTINLPNPATLFFYINDPNSVDNGASVKLEFSNVPIPGSLILVGSGLIAFIGWRRR